MNTPLRLILILSLSVFAANAAPVFRNPVPVRHSAEWVGDLLSADFNNDGYEDVLVAASNRSLNVLLSNGAGPFAPAIKMPISVNIGRPAIGDVNGDGKLDIVYASSNTSTVTIQSGNGDGTFTTGGSFVAPIPHADEVAIGDFNGDAFADIAVGSHASDSDLSIHLGNGSGQWSPGTVTTDGSFSALYAADLNGDGKADLVSGDTSGNRVLISNGDGTFLVTQTVIDGEVVFGDFNHDGNRDIATAAGGSIQVYAGDGSGHFGTPLGYLTGYGTTSIDVADVDDDGNADLLGAGQTGCVVTVLRGNADGTFDASDYYLSGPGSLRIVVSDYDHDGDDDFVTADYNDTYGALSFVHGNGDGTFEAYRSTTVRSTIPDFFHLGTGHPVIADMNDDRRLDVVTIHQKGLLDDFDWAMSVLLNDGGGSLARPIVSTTAVSRYDSPQYDTADLNGDGWLDAVVVSDAYHAGTAVSLLGDGNGSFDPPAPVAVTSTGIPKLALFDGDAVVDLLVASNGSATVYPGNGNGTFGAGIQSNLGGWSMDRGYGDVNQDGAMDFIVDDIYADYLALNDGTGHFTTSMVSNDETSVVAFGDFDGDGKIDLLISTYVGVRILFGRGDGTFGNSVDVTIQPRPSAHGSYITADFDGDGNLDFSIYETVYLGNGDGTFRSRSRMRTHMGAAAVGDMDGSGSPDLVFTDGNADTVNVLLTRTAPEPTQMPALTLTASKTTAQYAELVTFDVVVAGGPVVVLTGAVVFSDDDRNVAIVDVDPDGKASFTMPFTVGSRTITATYTGDEYYREASDSVSLTVTKANPTIVLIGDPNPSQAGNWFVVYASLTASRHASLPLPTGTITVREGETAIGSPIDANAYRGSVYAPSTLSIGSHTISADYPGDANYSPATASYTHEVIKAIPTIYLLTTPTQFLAGQGVVLEARLSRTSATGTVSYYIDGALLATAALSGGRAQVQTSFTWGQHSIRMVYSGDETLSPTEMTTSRSVMIGPWGTPLVLRVTGSLGGISMHWSGVQGAVLYKLWRRTSLSALWTLVGTYNGTGGDASMPANTAQLFAVSAVDANGQESSLSAPDLATSVNFTDPTVVASVTCVKAQHFLELQAAIGYVRGFAGLPAFSYTNTIAAGHLIHEADLMEMRTALSQARSTIGLPGVTFTDATPTTIRAGHLTELRGGLD